MWFNSLDYLCFVAVVIPLFYALGGAGRAAVVVRAGFLVGASYFFYMFGNPLPVLLLFGSSVLDYSLGMGFLKWPREKQKWLIVISVCCHLSILAFFKYSKLLWNSAAHLLGLAGVDAPDFPWTIFLPAGISFYTFQSMAYIIDVYRGNAKVETSFLRYAVFSSYFPQLVAGPIERAGNLAGQLRESCEKPRPIDVGNALMQIAYGLFKKVAVADNLSAISDPVFKAPGNFSGAMVTTAAIFFSFQIYCDFSGYSDVAIGTAKLMGIRIRTNFLFPYFSANITEFWHRWHISLSTWLKDYLYISLGGNRKGRLRTYANLMITMTLGGLWHGATSWNFVIWGFMHGLFLAVHKRMLAFTRPDAAALEGSGGPKRSVARRALRAPWLLFATAFTFAMVTLTWIPFRCTDSASMWTCVRSIFTWAAAPLNGPLSDRGELIAAWALAGLLLLFDGFYKIEFHFWQNRRWVIAVKTALTVAFILLTIVFGAAEAKQFIYFQF
jgi:alginate O-acetyltransferase complex protein AlgI